MKKILLIVVLLNIATIGKELTAENCVGLTDKIMEFHTESKKTDTILNLTVLCDNGCGKACIKADMVKVGTTNIMDLKDDSLKIGCDSKLPYGKACYMRRWTDDKNLKAHISKGCEYGYSQACNKLASDYLDNKDYKNFSKYAKLSCNAGDAESCLVLATKYLSGKDGFSKDNKQAADFYKKAAELNNVEGLYNTGVMYMNGRGVEKNYKKAMKCYKKALKGGYDNALTNIEYMVGNGLGDKADMEEVVNYYKIAAEKGVLVAQFNLGLIYYMGESIEKDKIQAYKYWMMAAKQGNTHVQNNIDILCKESPWACK